MSKVETESVRDSDTAALRQALGCFVTGVTVVTTRDAGGVPHGFTANSFTSVSLDPPLVLVCVGHEVEGLEAFRTCAGFAVNMLSDSQRAISDTFASDIPDRFTEIRWREGSYGSPLLDGCVAFLECESRQRVAAGDHMILIGRVTAFARSAGRPLAFWRGSYLSLPRAAGAESDGGCGGTCRTESAASLEILCAETARLVMGWSAAEVPWAYDGVTSMWHTAGGEPVMTVFSWQPDRNDVHNMQVLDRMIALGFDLTLTVCGERTVVEVARASAPVARSEHRDRRVALLRAALGATQSLAE